MDNKKLERELKKYPAQGGRHYSMDEEERIKIFIRHGLTPVQAYRYKIDGNPAFPGRKYTALCKKFYTVKMELDNA